MCGIVGYKGNLNAKRVVIKGLERLEYRGYDSAGICYMDQSEFHTVKDKGRVAHLASLFSVDTNSNLAIGHTRWATHGEPSMVNSHPHSSEENRFVIVHNGVIDNYIELKRDYLRDTLFRSETDTEVIANLIEYFSKELDVLTAIRKTLSLLHGSYALVILDKEDQDVIYVAKNKSPLLIGLSEEGFAVASDITAIADSVNKFTRLDDFTIVKITDSLHAVDIIGEEVSLKIEEVDVDMLDAHKHDYEHYMLKEIDEQPSVMRRIIDQYYGNDSKVLIDENIIEVLKETKRIYIIAAGTSMNAGFIGAKMFEDLAGIPTEVHIASEFAYNPPIIVEHPLFIFLSQSGETADSIAALNYLKTLGYKSLTLSNVRTSTLAREADYFLDLYAGLEVAVASTKAYTAQIALLAIIAFELNDNHFDLKHELSKVAIAMEELIQNKDYYHDLVTDKITKRNCFYIGRGIDYYTGIEAALKLKEVSYIQTEGFAAGELKHGTIALIEQDTPVVAIITEKKIALNTRSNLQEVVSRGANKLVISLKSVSNEDDEIIIDDIHYLLAPLLTVVPTQFIAYYAALDRGLDIDKPRNLAKSVTVE